MAFSYITNMISFNQPPQYEGDDIDDELMLPIQMPESPLPSSTHAIVPKHHIISIIGFMRHTRHIHTQEHRITIPTISRL